MRYFIEPMFEVVSSQNVSLAARFAHKVAPTCNYSDHNQRQLEKIVEDHFLGKLGEFAVFGIMRRYTYSVSRPDLSISKSWNPDLVVDGVGVAVKSVSSLNPYGVSWVFSSDKLGRRDPILDAPDSWICFVEILSVDPVARCLVYPPLQVKAIKFEEPDRAVLRGRKLVVWKSSIIHQFEEVRI